MTPKRCVILDGVFVLSSAVAFQGAGIMAAEPLLTPLLGLGLDDRELMAPGGMLLLDTIRLHAGTLGASADELAGRGALLGLALSTKRIFSAYAAYGYREVPSRMQLAQGFILGLLVRALAGLLLAFGFYGAIQSAEAWIESGIHCVGIFGLGLVVLAFIRAFDSLVVLGAIGARKCPGFFGPVTLALGRLRTRPGRLFALTSSLSLGGDGLAFALWLLSVAFVKTDPTLASIGMFLALVTKISLDLIYQRALVASAGLRAGRPAEDEPRRS